MHAWRLIAVFLLLVYFPAAGAQTTTEVVVPVKARSLISIPAAANAQLSVNKGRLKGSAVIISDARNARYTLMITPDLDDGPSDITVSQRGVAVEIVHVYPVVTQPEEWIFESQAAPPDTTSRDYTTVTQKLIPHQGNFNGIDRSQLRIMEISGIRIVITPGDRQGTYERLMPGGVPPQDLAELVIYAKDVVIGAPLSLPGTKITIYAESLEFDDTANSIASIDVTPIEMSAQTSAGAAGLQGQDAPDIFLYLSKPFVNDRVVTRLIAHGGTGQQGGPPKPAQAGTDLPWLERDGAGTGGRIGGIVRSWGSIKKVIHDPLPPGWGSNYSASVNAVWFKRYGNFEFGNGQWPGDAIAGSSGGLAGIGGRGGTIHSSVGLTQSALNVSGGDAGPRQKDVQGALGGNPAWAVGVSIDHGSCRVVRTGPDGGGFLNICQPDTYNFYAHKSSSLPSIPSQDQQTKQGPLGSSLADLHGWSHPLAMRARLRYAEDLYRLGLLSQAEQELTAILTASSAAGGAVSSGADYLAVVQNSNALLARMSSNLDYFGNPGGWVPLIDFPTTYAILTTELHDAAPILIGTEEVRLRAEQAAANKNDLLKSRDAALDQMKKDQVDIQISADEVSALQVQAAHIAQDEQTLQDHIKTAESQLRQQAIDATRVSFLSGALKTLGSIAKVLPIGQPVVGAVGGALDFVSGIDERTPWQSIEQLPDIAKQFSQQNISNSVKSYHTFLNNINSLDPHNPGAVFSKISSAASDVGNSLAEFKKLQDSSRVPQSDMEAVLQKLEAEDTSLQSWIHQVYDLNAEKEAFQNRLDADMEKVGELTSKLTSQAQDMDSLTADLVAQQDQVDHPAIMAAQGISRSYRDRLEYYYYLFVKAYEYYTAEPYDGDRSPGLTADRLMDYVKDHNNSASDASDALEAAYLNGIRQAMSHIVTSLAKDGGPAETSAILEINSSDRDRLNQMLTPGGAAKNALSVDLEDDGIFRPMDLDARLSNVEILDCSCEKVSGPEGSVRFTLDAVPQGSNVIRTKNQNFGFRINAPASTWSTSVDLTTGHPIPTLSKVPADVGQIIAQMTNSQAPKPFATAPPLYPGLSIQVVPLFTDMTGQTKIHVTQMRLKLTYRYRADDDVNARAIRVTYSGTDAAPFFYVSARDDRQLQHAVGSFSRLYHDQQPVEIVAPPTVGASHFDGWYNYGHRVGADNHLNIPPRSPGEEGSYFYEARYNH